MKRTSARPRTIIRCGVLLIAIYAVVPVASADCFDEAAAYHGVNPWILRAIASVETRGCRGKQINKNKDGSIDVGCTQTNSVHFNDLGKYGIDANDLLDPCKSIFVAGWLYKKKVNKYGNSWTAVGAYHSETAEHRERYAAKIRSVVAAWTRSGLIK